MQHRLCVMGLTLLLAQVCVAETYTVIRDGDTGKGTLRWAIELANLGGSDTITFKTPMRIRLDAPLPPLTDPGTTIDGSMGGNSPTVVLDGRRLREGHGLQILPATASLQDRPVLPGPIAKPVKLSETIRGLAVVGFPGSGLYVSGRNSITVETCSFGIDPTTTFHGSALVLANGDHDIYMVGANHVTIGGTSGGDGNHFCCVSGDRGGSGLYLENCSNARIYGNTFGLHAKKADAILPLSRGVTVRGGQGHMIGGPGRGNDFSALTVGVSVSASTDNSISGNHFGKGGIPMIPYSGIVLRDGAHGNTIGGTASGAGNIFAGGGEAGVTVEGAGTDSNEILGNYFGVMPNGTRLAAPAVGVQTFTGAGALRIGTHVPATRNYFCVSDTGVLLSGAGGGSIVENNLFGTSPTGATVPIQCGVSVRGVRADILANAVRGGSRGVLVELRNGSAQVQRNEFAMCDCGVYIGEGASANLGDLGNTSILDEGGNTFDGRARNGAPGVCIANRSANPIMAEGNSFWSTRAADIDQRITDGRDNPGCGIVDYDPLLGGVHPD